jgi:hypothetical protein
MWQMEYYSTLFHANKILSEQKRLPVQSLIAVYRNTDSSIGQFTKIWRAIKHRQVLFSSRCLSNGLLLSRNYDQNQPVKEPKLEEQFPPTQLQ